MATASRPDREGTVAQKGAWLPQPTLRTEDLTCFSQICGQHQRHSGRWNLSSPQDSGGGKHCDNDKADFLNVIGSNFKRICNFHNDSFLKGREHVVCQRRGFAEACTQCCPGGWGRGAPGATILWPCLRPQAVFGRQALQYLQTVPLGQICRALELRRQRLLGAARDPCPRHARAVRTRQARPSQGIHPAG